MSLTSSDPDAIPPLGPVRSSGQASAAMRSVLDRMRKARRAPLHTLEPAQAREAYRAAAGVLELAPAPLAQVRDMTLPARDGAPLPARLYRPAPGRLPVLVYFHGGGFVIGSIETHDVLCRELARLSGCAVLSVEYRLAPEHVFPKAHEDAWDALGALHRLGPELGLDTRRIAVGGDSAGGTLAASCAIHARDAGLDLALQLLIYPGVAPRPDLDSHHRYASGYVLERDHIEWFHGLYLPNHDQHDWRFAPLTAPDLDGLAPAWIGLAELDPLHDEGLAYADRLRLCGIAVDLEIYRGVTHEFIKMGRALPEARQAHLDASRALQQALEP